MRYTLAQLEAFYWVGRLGGFHKAARRLHLTQPTVSLRVRELEDALKATLIDRTRYRPRLTAAGHAVHRRAAAMLALADDLANEARFADPLRGLLRVGATDTFAMIHLAELLLAVEEDHPMLQVEVTVDYSTRLEAMLLDKALDLAFMTNPASQPEIRTVALGTVALSWFASPRLALEAPAVEPRHLASIPVITNPPPSHLYTSVESWFASAGLKAARISTCNPLHIMTRLTAAGVGVALLPPSILGVELQTGQIRMLRSRPPVAGHVLCAAYRAEHDQRGIDPVIALAQRLVSRDGLFTDGGDGTAPAMRGTPLRTAR